MYCRDVNAHQAYVNVLCKMHDKNKNQAMLCYATGVHMMSRENIALHCEMSFFMKLNVTKGIRYEIRYSRVFFVTFNFHDNVTVKCNVFM